VRTATMRAALRLAWLTPAVLVACALPELLPAPTDPVYKYDRGPYSVREETYVWYDTERWRAVPVHLYLPEEAEGSLPLVVFSHGLGSTGDHYTYIGAHLASYGYMVVYPTHHGSDTQAIYGEGDPPRALLRVVINPAHRTNRARDISFVIDRVTEDRTLGQLVDTARIGVMGHSLGAFTALAAIGLRFDVLPGQPAVQFTDSRVRAAIGVSPHAPGALGLTESSWDDIGVPCMTMMGTQDRDFVTLVPTVRRASFEHCPGPDQYLVTLHGARHSTFDDTQVLVPGLAFWNPYHPYVQMSVIAFFDAYLCGEREAQQWLVQHSLEACGGGLCEIEYKNVDEMH
jgi:predicted dienelactone hydrolase